MMRFLLEARDISYQIAGKMILSHITLRLSPHGIVGIIGPNGAGKSTFLKIIAGHLSPTSGTIQYQGKMSHTLSAKELAQFLAVVNPCESLPSFPISARQYIGLGRIPYQDWLGRMTAEDRFEIEKALADCHISHLADSWIHTLSSGEMQKVQLARALAQSPQLMLLDEPTTYLDINAQLTLLALLQEIAAQGKGVLIVLHDLNLASLCCQELLLMHQGHCLVSGSPERVLNEAWLHQAYGSNWKVHTDPDTGKPIVAPRVEGKKV